MLCREYSTTEFYRMNLRPERNERLRRNERRLREERREKERKREKGKEKKRSADDEDRRVRSSLNPASYNSSKSYLAS